MTACPIPLALSQAVHFEKIVMAHGGGGRLSAQLFASVFLPAFDNDVLRKMEDQASITVAGARIAMTTDAFVVKPLFFPGGDIGRLAVCGTVNDLVVGGARPRFLTAAFVLEEGLPVEDLKRVVQSMKEACAEARITLVAGDTKVVDRGKGDGIYITTTGIGEIPNDRALSSANAKPGDAILVSGPIGDHGVAILSVREGLELETALVSDVAPLGGLVEAILERTNGVRCMRDPTRGGVASALHEIAASADVGMILDETKIPVRSEVRAACELFGFDPLYVANEGKLLAIVAPNEADDTLAAMRSHPLGRDASIIGTVTSNGPRIIRAKTKSGGERVVPLLAGEQLPRIC